MKDARDEGMPELLYLFMIMTGIVAVLPTNLGPDASAFFILLSGLFAFLASHVSWDE